MPEQDQPKTSSPEINPAQPRETVAASPEKKDSKSLQQEAQESCQTPEGKDTFISELGKSIQAKIEQFSATFRQKFFNDKGEPDLNKILTSLGLSGLTSEATPTTTTQASSRPTSQPHPTATTAPAELTTTPPAAASTAPTFTPDFLESDTKTVTLPSRPSNAPTGSQFMDQMDQLGNMNSKTNQKKMEEAILSEISRGNVPSFCRPENMKPITMTGTDGTKVTFRTSADYIAIGSNDDYVRVPMTPILAQALSQKYNWGLPTASMTDTIYNQATIRLTGEGLVSTQQDQMQMQGNAFIQRHNQKIEAQLGPDGHTRLVNGQALVAGHKKDVIISRYAIDHPGSLDFRGLYMNGKPIQHNPAHEDTYRDYSHGFRPVDGNIIVTDPSGKTRSIPYYQALQDPQIARVLNGVEGTLQASTAYRGRQQTFS